MAGRLFYWLFHAHCWISSVNLEPPSSVTFYTDNGINLWRHVGLYRGDVMEKKRAWNSQIQTNSSKIKLPLLWKIKIISLELLLSPLRLIKGNSLRKPFNRFSTRITPILNISLLTAGALIIVLKSLKSMRQNWLVGKRAWQRASDAINKGFQKAKGIGCAGWILMTHFCLMRLKKVEKIFNKNPKVDVITGNVIYINVNDFIVRYVRVPKMRWLFGSLE